MYDSLTPTTMRRTSIAYVLGVILALTFTLGTGLFFYGKGNNESSTGGTFSRVRSLDSKDHTLGSLSAPIQLIVFSNPDCPYCKRQHEETFPILIEEYRSRIVLGYRYTLLSIFPNSQREMEAIECAASIGGANAYWRFVDELYAAEPPDTGLRDEVLAQVASRAGLSASAHEKCVRSGDTKERVLRDTREAALAGINFTPTVIVRSRKEDVLVEGDDITRLRAAIEYLLALE